MTTVKQPSAWPTNKLSGALIAGFIMEIGAGQLIATVITPVFAMAGLTFGGPASMAILTLAISGLVGYFIKDKPNV